MRPPTNSPLGFALAALAAYEGIGSRCFAGRLVGSLSAPGETPRALAALLIIGLPLPRSSTVRVARKKGPRGTEASMTLALLVR